MRARYNKQSNDYKQLIASWAVYAGPPAPKPTKALVDHELLSSIPDARVRFIMQGYIIKCNKQEAQLNMLKSNTNVIVDRRLLGATISASPGSNAALILPPLSRLTETQRGTLQRVISPSFLDEMGWKERTHGEILKGDPIMLPVGFATAIRRIIED